MSSTADSADFKMIRPVLVTDTVLISTSVPEALVTEYSSGTSYATNTIAGVTVGTAQMVYRSLQSGNVGHTPATSPTWWLFLATVYAPYAVGTTYSDGAIVSAIGTDTHLLYRSLIAGNLGNALTDITKWQPYGSTNARAMFDDVYGSQTTCAESIVNTVTPGTLVNSIFLGNLEASSVTVTQTISGFSRTVNLNSHPVRSWYDFYYEPLLRDESAVFTDIPPYAASSLTITVSNPGDTAKCGLCVIGKSATLGKTQWEVQGGLISFSGTTTDIFGRKKFMKRPSANRLSLEVAIHDGYESEATRLLTRYSDEPIVFIGSTDYRMTMIYAALGSWSVPISNSGKNASIELLGLT